MLVDPRIERMAGVLVSYSLEVKPGWTVTILAGVPAIPLVKAVYREVLRVGAYPYVILDVQELSDLRLSEGTDDQLAKTDPYRLFASERSDAVLDISSDENTRSLTNLDPSRQAAAAVGAQPIRSANAARIATGRPRCLTLFPTAAFAQDAEMSLREFEDFVFHACLLDRDEDPADLWRQVSRDQQRIVDWLAGRRKIHVEGPNIDLTMSIEGRNFVNSDGKRNFPSGEVFTSPVESSVEGHIAFSFPASYGGRSVQGVSLTFEKGRVVSFEAGQGADYLAKMLKLDEGASMLGEFAVGTNEGVTQITRNVLFDEKMAGTIHCALGNAYTNAGGTNKSAIHWDMVTDMKEGRVIVDGTTIYEKGEFVI